MQGPSLSYRWKTSTVVIKLIVLNVAIFLVTHIAAFLFQTSTYALTSWFVLPDDFSEIILQPWSLLTYSFLHGGFFHILFNMLWLHWFSRYFLNIFTEKRLLTLYLLGALIGGLTFVIAYNLFPVFESQAGYLIGASAAVSALMIFIATYTPNSSFRIFTFTIKLWQLALFLFLLDLFRLGTGENPGGMLSHIGGGIFGYFYAVQLAKGKDIGKWFENIMDYFTDLFKSRKQKPFKKVHKTPPTYSKTTNATMDKSERQKKVDAILDKIGKSGYDSLTKAEKDFLFKAGNE